jgi:hypothetical protein
MHWARFEALSYDAQVEELERLTHVSRNAPTRPRGPAAYMQDAFRPVAAFAVQFLEETTDRIHGRPDPSGDAWPPATAAEKKQAARALRALTRLLTVQWRHVTGPREETASIDKERIREDRRRVLGAIRALPDKDDGMARNQQLKRLIASELSCDEKSAEKRRLEMADRLPPYRKANTIVGWKHGVSPALVQELSAP